MLDAIKDAVIARTIEALRADLDQAGRSLRAVFSQPETLTQMDAQTAWKLIHGLEASLSVAEQTLRDVRRSPGMPSGPMRRAVTDLLTVVSHFQELLHTRLVPMAEKTYDLPPQGTRWQIEPPR